MSRAKHADANFVGLNDGTAGVAGALAKVVPRDRWNLSRVQALACIPGTPKATFDSLVAEPERHNVVSSEAPPEPEDALAPR